MPSSTLRRVRSRSISAQSCTSEASPRWEKNWQHCSQEFYWRMWIDSNTHQIAVFLLPGDSFWPMKHGWCHLCHFWVEAWKAQMWLSSLSLFPAPEAACSRWCMCKSLTDHKHLYVVMSVRVSVYECVCMFAFVSVCVYLYMCVFVRFGGHFIQQQSRVSSEGYKGERRLEKKIESVTWSRYFPGSPLPSVSSSQAVPSHLVSSIGLGCFSVTISDWQTTRCKSSLRAPTPGTSPVPFTSLCADSQAQFPEFVS